MVLERWQRELGLHFERDRGSPRRALSRVALVRGRAVRAAKDGTGLAAFA